jgi:hypothetical protein
MTLGGGGGQREGSREGGSISTVCHAPSVHAHITTQPYGVSQHGTHHKECSTCDEAACQMLYHSTDAGHSLHGLPGHATQPCCTTKHGVHLHQTTSPWCCTCSDAVAASTSMTPKQCCLVQVHELAARNVVKDVCSLQHLVHVRQPLLNSICPSPPSRPATSPPPRPPPQAAYSFHWC